MTELVSIINNQVKTTSNLIADTFGKRHCDVLRAIKDLEVPEDFRLRNFAHSTFKTQNRNGLSFDNYEITRDGFTLLAMGFTGKKAMEFKIKYINAFNEMEKALMDKHARFSALPFDPVPYTPADFVGNKEFMKAIGGIVKKCCAVAIREELKNDNPTSIHAIGALVDYISEKRTEQLFAEWKNKTQKQITQVLS